ncbi:MAG: hypothetical protein VX078_04230 [Pseudomonadota bacterium]|nr:hypothetical protein [Pseudomonadota bacterium]
MSTASYLNKALATLLNEDSTEGAKDIAKEVLANSGLTENDIQDCIKQRTVFVVYIFEA